MDLLAAEITARTEKNPSQHFSDLVSEFGRPYYTRIDKPASPEQKAILGALAPESIRASSLAGEPIAARLISAPGSDAIGTAGIADTAKRRGTHDPVNDRRSELAIEIFCYRARKYIGAYLAAMNGADAVVFTGGIGENSPEVRARFCDGLQWIGIELGEELNRSHTGGREGLISREGSRLSVYVIPTDEELLIARDTVRCVLKERQHS